MKKAALLCFCLGILSAQLLGAQTPGEGKFKVAFFVPLHLDSAFDAGNNYRYGKSFPRQSIPGLEFYTGAEYAIDSLKTENEPLDFHVFDTKSKEGSIAAVDASALMDSVDLIIGQVSGTEYLQLSEIARKRNIPFVSATYPNDGGVKANPNVIIVNSKLNTHIQSLYNYILRNWGPDHIVYLRRKNAADDRIEDIFKQLNQSPGGGVLKYKSIIVSENLTVADLKKLLDSNRQNIVISGSLDETFGIRIASAATGLGEAYRINLVGMPTWEGNRDLARAEFSTLPVVFSSTFYISDTAWEKSFEDIYRRKTFSKPTDMVYRGFEITHFFVRLLLKYDTTLISHLDDPILNKFTGYDFRPIRWNKEDSEPDYYENKRIFILRRLNGTISRLQ